MRRDLRESICSIPKGNGSIPKGNGSIPKGLRLKAQGCEARATLGYWS